MIGRRVLVTIGVLILIRVLYFIPLPGIQLKTIVQLYQQHIRTEGGSLIDLMVLLHIGRLRNISLCSLGIMPFFNACIILQIIGFLIPGLNRKFFYEKNGRSRMMLATLCITLILSLIHGFLISLDVGLLNQVPGLNILSFTGILFQAVSALSLSAMVMIFVLLSRIIDEFGFGNGVGMIFAVEVLIRMIFGVDQLVVFWGRKLIGVGHLIIFSGITIAFVYFARKATRFLKKIELCTDEDEKFFISIRPFWISICPLIIAEIIFSFFEISFNIFSFICVSLTIIFFTLLYARIIYQPQRFYELILTHKCRLDRARDKKIVDYLNISVLQTTALTAVLFIIIYYLPIVLPLLLNISFISAGIFGTFGLIVLVGVYYDIKRQLKFFRRIGSLPLKKWSLLNVANDETEAEIQKACLRSQGIITEIKPSHFSWGLPIRTIASGYCLYVPHEDKVKADSVLEQRQREWQEKSI